MKTTKATIKSFILKNSHNLYINVKSSFDGMTDCCESQNEGFTKVLFVNKNTYNTLNIPGAWFVNGGRDYFYTYEDTAFIGYVISNACGRFILSAHK